MAVGGLPSKRQGRLGRPKDHRRPPAMDFTPSFLLSLFSPPSSLSTFFFTSFFLSFSSLAHSLACSLSSSSLACSLSFSSHACSLAFSYSSAYSTSYSFSSPIPFLLLFTTSCETSHRLRLFGATPRDQARYPPTRTRPCHSGLPPRPRHRPHPVFFKTNPERLEPQ